MSTDVHPSALYVDHVGSTTKRDGVVGFFIYSLVTQRRHLRVAVRKSDLCRCGCRGWCSLVDSVEVPGLELVLIVCRALPNMPP